MNREATLLENKLVLVDGYFVHLEKVYNAIQQIII